MSFGDRSYPQMMCFIRSNMHFAKNMKNVVDTYS